MFSTMQSLDLLDDKSVNERTYDLDRDDRYFTQGCFVKEQYDLWVYVKENLDPNPIVIDSDDVLSDPGHMLSKYCSALSIPYSDCMIAWDGNPKLADKWWQPFHPLSEFLWGRIVFGNAMFSKGFLKPNKLPSLDEVTPDIRESYEFVKPYYEEMYQARMKP